MIRYKPGEADISGIKVSKNKFKLSMPDQVRQEHAHMSPPVKPEVGIHHAIQEGAEDKPVK